MRWCATLLGVGLAVGSAVPAPDAVAGAPPDALPADAVWQACAAFDAAQGTATAPPPPRR